MTDEFTIAQLAARTGVSVRTIRFYAAMGLVPPPVVRGKLGLYDERTWLWVLNRLSTSCDLGVLVYEPPEAVVAWDATVGWWRGWLIGSEWWGLAEGAVWPVMVEVRHVLGEHALEMPAVDD